MLPQVGVHGFVFEDGQRPRWPAEAHGVDRDQAVEIAESGHECQSNRPGIEAIDLRVSTIGSKMIERVDPDAVIGHQAVAYAQNCKPGHVAPPGDSYLLEETNTQAGRPIYWKLPISRRQKVLALTARTESGASSRARSARGAKMTGTSYRVPCRPVAPGSTVPDDEMCIIEAMPVKSLITYPKSGIEHAAGEALRVRGHAWVGDDRIRRVEVSTDFGATWKKAKLERPANRQAWQHWRAEVDFPQPGYYEVWAKATDASGRSQPMVMPAWNPKGYLNNACHRIAVQVA